MSHHSVADARNRLSELLGRAERGEEVVITRHGVPIVELKPIQQTPVARGPTTEAELEWLACRRVKLRSGLFDSEMAIRQMRDEGY
jgi:prevent-host-death family protein